MRSERRRRGIGAAALAVLAFTAFGVQLAGAQEPALNAAKIQVQPGTVTTKLIVETDGPLSSARGYYLLDAPQTFILELTKVQTTVIPAVPPSEGSFIRDVQVQKSGSQDLRITVRLNARVPVRVSTDPRRAVVEFIKVQRYVLDPEVEAQLGRGFKRGIYLDKVDASETADRLSFRIPLNQQAVTNVFSLENPARLVVDFYDVILRSKADVWAAESPQASVQRARVGQFERSAPRPIARLVFDLKEPDVYSVDSDPKGLTVSFYRDMPRAAAEPKAAEPAASETKRPPVKGAPVEKAAPKAETPKASAVETPGPKEPAAKAAPAPAAQAAGPLIRKDLLVFGRGQIPPPRRDIFHPQAYLQSSSMFAPRLQKAKAAAVADAPAFVLDLVYVGSVRSSGQITALILRSGQTTPVSVGDEIIPGYKVIRITADEIEVEGPNSERKIFSRQGDRP